MSQQDLATAVGLERTMVNRIEGGQRKVTALELASIADALGTRMQSFFTEPAPALVSHRSAQGLIPPSRPWTTCWPNSSQTSSSCTACIPSRGSACGPWEQPKSVHEADDMAARAREHVGYTATEPVKDLQAHLATAGLLLFSRNFGVDAADAGTVLAEGGISW